MKKEKPQQNVPKIIHFFKQNKNPTNNLFTRSQPKYSEDEDYFNQNLQRYNNIPQKNWNDNCDQPHYFYQPEIFETYMNSEQTRQTQ